MKKNIKIWLIAAMAVISGNVWGGTYTWPAGTYYIEFVGFNSTNDQKVFHFNIFDRINEDGGYNGNIIQLANIGTCNDDIVRRNYNYYYTRSNTEPMDVIVLTVGSSVTMADNHNLLRVPVGPDKTHTTWDNLFDWKKYSDVGTPSAFSSGVYYLKITRTNSTGSYTTAWQTSGSLPACANPGHTLTFNKTGNGSVSAKVGGSAQSSPVSSVEEGTTIVLTATPSSSVFTCWKVGDDIVSYDNPYTRTMPDEDLTVTAVFETDNRVNNTTCKHCFKVTK